MKSKGLICMAVKSRLLATQSNYRGTAMNLCYPAKGGSVCGWESSVRSLAIQFNPHPKAHTFVSSGTSVSRSSDLIKATSDHCHSARKV